MEAKEILKKVVDEEGVKQLLLVDVLDGIVKAKLDEIVNDSSNSIDNAAVEFLYPLVRAEVEKRVDELLGLDVPPAPAA